MGRWGELAAWTVLAVGCHLLQARSPPVPTWTPVSTDRTHSSSRAQVNARPQWTTAPGCRLCCAFLKSLLKNTVQLALEPLRPAPSCPERNLEGL